MGNNVEQNYNPWEYAPCSFSVAGCFSRWLSAGQKVQTSQQIVASFSTTKKSQRKARQPRALRPRAAQPRTRLEAAVGLEFSGLRCRREEIVSVSRGVSEAGARPGHRRKHSNGAGPCSVASLSCRKYTQSSAPTTPTPAGKTSCCRAGL